MKKSLLYCFCIIFLSGCKDLSEPLSEPLIEDEMVKLTVECKNGEKIVADDSDVINKVIKEINSSEREGTQEMEFVLEHQATFENSDGKSDYFNLYSSGGAVVSGYYIHSNIEDLCGK